MWGEVSVPLFPSPAKVPVPWLTLSRGWLQLGMRGLLFQSDLHLTRGTTAE